MDIEYIRVSAFAKRANITKHKAYQLVKDSRYSSFVKVENGTTLISTSLLLELDSNNIDTDTVESIDSEAIENTSNSSNDTGTTVEKTIVNNSNDSEVISFLMKQIEMLQEDIRNKDKIISDNNNRIATLLEKQQELTEKALTTTAQAQYLQATTAIEDIQTEAIIQTPEKTGFWQRLFRKNKG